MARTRLALAALALALASPDTLASPQDRSAPIPDTNSVRATPAKSAGTYYAATGQFVRNGGASRFSAAEAIYSSTAETPYFSDVNPNFIGGAEFVVDDGVIPGSTNPVGSVTRDDNLVTSFDFGYCDLDTAPGASAWEIAFYESLAPCTSPTGITPTAVVTASGLPTNGCWTVNVDLSGGQEFCIGGDGGDGVYDDDLNLDAFGWSVRYTGSSTAQAGPRIGSDPSATDAGYSNPNGPPSLDSSGVPLNPPAPAPVLGTATYYNPLSNCTSFVNPSAMPAPSGSGLLNQDFFYREDNSGGLSGCFYFLGYFNVTGTCGNADGNGNNVYSAFYMRILSSGACSSSEVSVPTSCAATPNSTGVAGTCSAVGSAVAADNDVVLRACNLPTDPAGVFGVFIHGLDDISDAPVVSGQGVMCIGSVGRMQGVIQVTQANANGVAELSTAAGQFDLSSLPISAAPFTIAATAGLTSYFGFWHRDFVTPPSEAFNYTGTCAVTWQ
ncbi:MAG: hypothetical protein AAFR54_06160 [Planctomycetota bacterium]